MGNGEALFGVVEHNQVSSGGSLEAWDIVPGQPGSWILMKRGGPEKAYQPAVAEAIVPPGAFSADTTTALGLTKYQEMTLTHPGKSVYGRKSVSGFYWCRHSCVSSCRFPGVGWVLWSLPQAH